MNQVSATSQLPSVADIFERILVPAVFDRYARDLVERARPIGASDRILDLGCGTGIVARVLRERLGGAARIVGVDASAPMIAKAKAVAPGIEFHEANAMALPFADESLDLVLSQQMLQFVPDRVLALREVRRVLSPGGRLIASSWRPRAEQPLHDAFGRVAERHFGKSNDARYSLDGDALSAALAAAGFEHVRVETASLTERFTEFPLRANIRACGFDLGALSDTELERRLLAMEADSAQVLARFALDGGFGAPSVTNVASAVAPSRPSA